MTPELVKASLERTIEMSNRVPEFFDIASIEVDGPVSYTHLLHMHRKWQMNMQT